MKGSVRGLTTAAGIWMTACIGLAVGAGMFVIATAACFLIIAILKAFEFFDPETNTVHAKEGNFEVLYGNSSQDKDLKKLSLTVK